ncbi:c-type cytochrome domain-containing protein [Rubripirellula reticaptiva]|uniref:Planctomycete cytochrome C n=1 Tax=Rubripirellula reticaptiva TaxID=2528013 RepID=A0A5C6F9V1_9BACT|nr:c-type cytochrome domain-containing protein [Rubripirellula reticaptiva]TWU57330.1 Planctomycete cytochrome C [Rubripirellula reticaptiva]
MFQLHLDAGIARFIFGCLVAFTLTVAGQGRAAVSSAQDAEVLDVEIVEVDAAETTPLDENGHLVQFGRDIAPLLVKHCLECHGPDDAKNDFRVDDRDMMMDYLEPDDADSSTLYVDYLTTDDEDMLMPPRSHGGPLSAGELALVKVWINEGADWPEDFAIDGSRVAVLLDVDVDVAQAPKSLLERVWAAQGFLHPATVHFPIALLMFGAGFVVLGWKWPSLGTQIPLACLLFGAVSAVGATLMGWSFATEQGYGSWNRFDAEMMDREIFWHRWSGVIVSILSVGFAIVALLSLRGDRPKMNFVWKFGLLVCAAISGLVGHQGGEMSYGEDFYPKMFRTLLGTEKVDVDSVDVEVVDIEVVAPQEDTGE